MEDLKIKWNQQEPLVRFGIAAAAAVVALLVVLKILPALVAGLGIGLVLFLLFVPYWLPTIIAFKRNHPSKGGILAVNFFFGWTFVGWIVPLVWALSDNSRRQVNSVIIQNHLTTTVAGTATAPPVRTYAVGDTVNGHVFTGSAWLALPPASASQPTPSSGAAPMSQQALPHQQPPIQSL